MTGSRRETDPNAKDRPNGGDSRAGRVLVVDDDEGVRKALTRSLSLVGLDVATAADADEAIAAISRSAPDVVLTDYRMPGTDGIALLRLIREKWPRIQRVLISGQADVAALTRAINDGAVFRFIPKPWETPVLLSTVEMALEDARLREENARLVEMTREQNKVLTDLARTLEAKVNERTVLIERAKRDWETTFDAIQDPLAIVRPDRTIQRCNTAFAAQAALRVKEMPGRRCYESLMHARDACAECPLDACVNGAVPADAEVRDEASGRVFKVWSFPILEEGRRVRAAVCYYKDVTADKFH